MSKRERDQLVVRRPVVSGKRSTAEAAALLGLSVRQARRPCVQQIRIVANDYTIRHEKTKRRTFLSELDIWLEIGRLLRSAGIKRMQGLGLVSSGRLSMNTPQRSPRSTEMLRTLSRSLCSACPPQLFFMREMRARHIDLKKRTQFFVDNFFERKVKSLASEA